MNRHTLISPTLALLAGFICAGGIYAQEVKPPTEAEVKALQAGYKTELEEILKKGIDKHFPPDLMKQGEVLAERADKALAGGRLFQAAEAYRQARWTLPYQPAQVPGEHLARVLGSLRLRHDDRITAVAFSPDGKLLASASADRTVKIWDLDNGHERLTYKGHNDVVSTIAFSPDGKVIASGAAEPDIRVWDPLTGKDVEKIPGDGAFIYTLAFTPDGKYLVSGQAAKGVNANNLLCLHEVESWKLHRKVADFRTKPHCLSFAADGSVLAVATSDGEIRLFDYPRMVKVLTQPAYWSQQHDTAGQGCHVAISPDNKTLIRCGPDGVKLYSLPQPKDKFVITEPRKILPRGSYRANCVIYGNDAKSFVLGCSDGSVRLIDAQTLNEIAVHKGHGGEVKTLAYNANGSMLASAGLDHTIRLWESEMAVPARDFVGHEGPVWKSSFSPDGRRLLSASADRSVRIWDVAGGKVVHTLTGHTAPVTSARFSPDGKLVASAGGDRVVKIWDAESAQCLRDLAGHTNTITCLDFASDGKKVVSGGVDRTIKVWDPATGKELVSFDNNTIPAAVVFSPDRKQIVTGNVDGSIKIYNELGKLQASWSAHGSAVTGLDFSPDGKLLASSGTDQVARIWTVARPGSQSIALAGHAGPVSAVAFRKDGQHVATCGGDGMVKLWVLSGDSAKEVQTFRGHKDWLTSVNFSKDGFYVVSSGVDRVIKVSEISMREGPSQVEQSGNLLTVAVSPDGKMIASGGTDGTVKVWDRASGDGMVSLVGHDDLVTALVFTADNKRLISGSRDGTLKTWDLATGKEIPHQPAQLRNWTRLKSAPPLLMLTPDGAKLYMWEPAEGEDKATRIGVFDAANGNEFFSVVDNGRDVRAVSFSANGKTIALASYDGTLRLFDMDKKGQGFPGGDWFLYDKKGQSSDIALTPDGAFLAAAGVNGELRISRVAGKELLRTIKAHSGLIHICLASPDGKLVATAGQDNLVKLWDLATGKELRRWSLQPEGDTTVRRTVVSNLAFTPDSKQLITSNANTTVYVLDLP